MGFPLGPSFSPFILVHFVKGFYDILSYINFYVFMSELHSDFSASVLTCS